jgi:hypothetical protein
MRKARKHFFSHDYRFSVQDSNLVPHEYQAAVVNHSTTIFSANLLQWNMATVDYFCNVIMNGDTEESLTVYSVQPREMPTANQCAVRLDGLLISASRTVSIL